MSSITKNNAKPDEKTNEFMDDITIDNNLINKLKEMNNNNIGEQLFNYILDDNTTEFVKLIYHCDVLSNTKKEAKRKVFSKIGKNKLDLDKILNKKGYGPANFPLIVVAAYKSNLDIAKTLIKYNVCFVFFIIYFTYFCDNNDNNSVM